MKIYLPLVIFFLSLLIYSFWETNSIEFIPITIRNINIPDSFLTFKIVFLTDIHYGPYTTAKSIKNLVGKVNEYKPDLVLLGGDYVFQHEKYISRCFKELKNLTAQYGVYGVLGNHDHWENAELTRQQMKFVNITLLDNKAYWIYKNKHKIKIGGVGDLWEDKQNIQPTIDDVSKDDFVILVSHNPDYIESITTDKIDLVLSGHTHGGQITFFGLWAPYLPSYYGQKYRTGIKEIQNIKLLISNGVGTIGLPLRFFARPQVLLIELKK